MNLVRVICNKCDGDKKIFRFWKYWIENILTTGIKPEIMRLRNRFHACYIKDCNECKGKGYVEADWKRNRDWEADDCRSGDWI